MAEDDPVVRRAVAGDAAAFDALVRRHQSAVRGFLRRVTGNDHALADDLGQETFLHAWRKKEQFLEGAFLSWLYAIAWSRFLMQARQRKTLSLGDLSLGDGAARIAVPSSAQGSLAKLDLEKALAHCAPAESAAITLCLGLGYVHEEAAAILGLPLGTLKSHIARGREKIKILLKDHDHAA